MIVSDASVEKMGKVDLHGWWLMNLSYYGVALAWPQALMMIPTLGELKHMDSLW